VWTLFPSFKTVALTLRHPPTTHAPSPQSSSLYYLCPLVHSHPHINHHSTLHTLMHSHNNQSISPIISPPFPIPHPIILLSLQCIITRPTKSCNMTPYSRFLLHLLSDFYFRSLHVQSWEANSIPYRRKR
jgi:hypothetical protein